jgi:proteasome activator subunit 4
MIEFRTHTFRFYGKTHTPEDAFIEWHVPTDSEVDCASMILDVFARRTLDEISKITDPLATGFSNNLCRWLCWFKSIILSLNALLEPQDSYFETSSDDIFQEPHERAPIKNVYAVSKSHPRFNKLKDLRDEIGLELARISRLLLCGYGEDLIEPVKALIKDIFLFMTFRGAEYGRFDGFSRLISFLKTMIRSEEDHKNLPRAYTIKRLYLLHLTRLKYNSSKSKYEPVYQVLMDAVFQFTVSKYSQIRRASLPSLSRILRCFPAYKYSLFPKYLEILSSASSEEKDHDVIDGACQVLRSSSFLGMTLRHWSFAQMLLLTLVKAEKNIQRVSQKYL